MDVRTPTVVRSLAVSTDPRYLLRVDRRYPLPGSVHEVWDHLEQLDRFPQWWRWLRGFEVDGNGLRAGTELRAMVRPPVPYPFRVTVTFDEVDPPHHIRAHLTGDVTGPAELHLSPRGDGCEAHVRWTVEMHRTAMRRAAVVARPAIVWGHDQVVTVTVRRFRAVL